MKKQRLQALFLGFLLLALLCAPVLTLWDISHRENQISFYENRRLAAPPALSAQALWSGSFWTDLDGYLSDHFTHRDDWIKLDIRTDLLLHRTTSHKLVVTDRRLLPFHGYLRWDLGYVEGQAAKMAQGLASIRDLTTQQGGTLIYLGLPSQYNYFRGDYPAYMDDRGWQSDENFQQFSQALEAQSIPFVNAQTVYDAQGRPENYYYSSDHHYTYWGMLAAYQALMGEICRQTGLELKIYGQEDLVMETLPTPFLGSSNRALFDQWPSDDRLEIGRLKEPIPFTRLDNGLPVASTLYALPAEGDYAIYGVYMGGDVAETVIQTDRPHLPKLLIWGDSFTNAMETLLWASFDETRSLDLRYYTEKTLSEYIAEYRPDVVVCIRDDSAYLNFEGNGALS